MNVLISRRDTIRLLILAELAINKECNQRDIAKKLNLTPQAISEHFKELVNEGTKFARSKGIRKIVLIAYLPNDSRKYDYFREISSTLSEIYDLSIEFYCFTNREELSKFMEKIQGKYLIH